MSTYTLTDALVEELTALSSGAVLPASEAVEDATGFQLGVHHRPDVVTVASSTDDVRAAVRVAADRDLPLTVHHTGHGTRIPADGGILLATERMNGIVIDPDARTARVGAGVAWSDVTAAAEGFGLMGPSGSFPGVGAIGYSFGGGLGLTGRSDGWAVDHVRAYEVVHAEGDLYEVTADSDPDRFARLRGTGPQPGEVVTAMTIGLLPAGPLTGGHLLYDLGPSDEPGDAAPLHAFREWTSDLPDTVTSGMEILAYPDWDVLPPFLRERRMARIAVVVRAGSDETDRLLAPLRATAPPFQDTIGPLRPVEAARVYDEPAYPHGYTAENLLLNDLVPAGLDAVAALDVSMLVVGIRHLGGALARPAAVRDTVSGRDAVYMVSALELVDPELAATDPAAAVANVDLSRALHAFAPARVGTNRNFTYGPSAA